MNVGEGSHPNKVKVYGPGVEKTGLKANEPTYFTVDCSEAGQGKGISRREGNPTCGSSIGGSGQPACAPPPPKAPSLRTNTPSHLLRREMASRLEPGARLEQWLECPTRSGEIKSPFSIESPSGAGCGLFLSLIVVRMRKLRTGYLGRRVCHMKMYEWFLCGLPICVS